MVLAEVYDYIVLTWFLIGLITFIVLLFIVAPYGKFTNEQWGRLQLEYGAWSVNDRIDEYARTKLNMKEPIYGLVVLIK